jgi:glycerophosphoryl diester phosphodiesterase
MKKLAIALVVIGLSSFVMKKPSNPVIAHRGAFKKNQFPENSIAALKEAIRLGCYGSEFDVHMTADDSLIINHDPHYNKLEVEKTPYAELVKTPLSNGEKLPTLREYIQAGNYQKKTKLILEIKPSSGGAERARKIVANVVRMVKELKAEKNTIYISFDYDMLLEILKLDSKANTQYLKGDKSPSEVKKDGIRGIDYNFMVFKNNPSWIEEAKKHKLALNAWTVNKKEDCEWLLANGFDFITTNEPEMLLELRK